MYMHQQDQLSFKQCNTFLIQSSDTVVPPKVLEDLDLSNKKAIAAIFAKPSIYLIQNLQKFPTSTHFFKLEATSKRLLKAAKEVKLPKADRQLFWPSKGSVGIYGPPANMYSYILDI